jgi:hypothetical protein
MTLLRMDNVGIVAEDLPATIAFLSVAIRAHA